MTRGETDAWERPTFMFASSHVQPCINPWPTSEPVPRSCNHTPRMHARTPPSSRCALIQVAAFTETVRRAQERGSDTVLRMACGLQDLMRGGDGEEEALERIQEFLDEFYQVRVFFGVTTVVVLPLLLFVFCSVCVGWSLRGTSSSGPSGIQSNAFFISPLHTLTRVRRADA